MEDLFTLWSITEQQEIPSNIVMDILGAMLTMVMSGSVMNVFLTQRIKILVKCSTSSGAFAISGICAVIITLFLIFLSWKFEVGMVKFVKIDFSLLLVSQFLAAALIVMIGSNWFFDRTFFKNFLSWIGMDKKYQHQITKYRKKTTKNTKS